MEKWQHPETIIYWLIVIIGVLIIMVGTVIGIFYISIKRSQRSQKREIDLKIKHKNQLIQTNLNIQEQERIRIASELHDGIIGNLTALRLRMAIPHTLEDLDKHLAGTIEEIRKISHNLYPPMYEESSLDYIIDHYLQSFKKEFNIKTFVNLKVNHDVPTKEKIQLFRIVQEIMMNIKKHAKAKNIHIYLRYTKRYMSLLIQDDGIGFNVKENSDGIGMQNLEMRCLAIHAQYKFKSNRGLGTRFILLKYYEEN